MRVEERQIFTVLLGPVIAYPEIIWDELATSDARVRTLMAVAERLSLTDLKGETLGGLACALKSELPVSTATFEIVDEILTCVALSGPIELDGGIERSTYE